jgi:hypothetical protein
MSLLSNSESEEEEAEEERNAAFLQERVSDERCQLQKMLTKLAGFANVKHPSKRLHEKQ